MCQSSSLYPTFDSKCFSLPRTSGALENEGAGGGRMLALKSGAVENEGGGGINPRDLESSDITRVLLLR